MTAWSGPNVAATDCPTTGLTTFELLAAFGLQPRLGLRRRLPTLLTRPQRRRRFITAIASVPDVLFPVNAFVVIQQLLNNRDIRAVAIP